MVNYITLIWFNRIIIIRHNIYDIDNIIYYNIIFQLMTVLSNENNLKKNW